MNMQMSVVRHLRVPLHSWSVNVTSRSCILYAIQNLTPSFHRWHGPPSWSRCCRRLVLRTNFLASKHGREWHALHALDPWIPMHMVACHFFFLRPSFYFILLCHLLWRCVARRALRFPFFFFFVSWIIFSMINPFVLSIKNPKQTGIRCPSPSS